MNSVINKHDAIEQLIYNESVKIQALDIHVEMDMFLIILNTGSVLKEKLSQYSRLAKAINKRC